MKRVNRTRVYSFSLTHGLTGYNCFWLQFLIDASWVTNEYIFCTKKLNHRSLWCQLFYSGKIKGKANEKYDIRTNVSSTRMLLTGCHVVYFVIGTKTKWKDWKGQSRKLREKHRRSWVMQLEKAKYSTNVYHESRTLHFGHSSNATEQCIE